MVVLSFPLDRLARPRIPRAALALPPGLREGPVEPTTAPTPAPTPSSLPAKPAPVRVGLADARLARRLVQAALRVRGTLRAEDRLDGLATRSRASSALPELTLRAVRSTDESLRLSPSGTYTNDYTQTGGAGLLFEARATWKLDRLVFADEELHVERLRAQQERANERVVASVLKQLFTWRRAQVHLLDAELSPEDRLRYEVEQLEAEAALDVLTDGLFSRERRAEETGSVGSAPGVPAAAPGQTPGPR
jgi:hypothetical protein